MDEWIFLCDVGLATMIKIKEDRPPNDLSSGPHVPSDKGFHSSLLDSLNVCAIASIGGRAHILLAMPIIQLGCRALSSLLGDYSAQARHCMKGCLFLSDGRYGTSFLPVRRGTHGQSHRSLREWLGHYV